MTCTKLSVALAILLTLCAFGLILFIGFILPEKEFTATPSEPDELETVIATDSNGNTYEGFLVSKSGHRIRRAAGARPHLYAYENVGPSVYPPFDRERGIHPEQLEFYDTKVAAKVWLGVQYAVLPMDNSTGMPRENPFGRSYLQSNSKKAIVSGKA